MSNINEESMFYARPARRRDSAVEIDAVIGTLLATFGEDTLREHWKALRDALKDNDIDTYYAVHSDGHSDGWKGLTQLLKDKIETHMDVIRDWMDEPNAQDEILAAKLRGRIDGLRDALQLLTESNQ